MQRTLATPHFAVFDDVLPAAELRSVWRRMRDEKYAFVNAHEWERVYSIFDGRPLEGLPIVYGASEEEIDRYPSGRALDPVLRAVIRQRRSFERWVGRRGTDWSTLTARPFLYPQDTGLAWHDDGPGRTGAWSFYVHPEWDRTWGGELLIGTDHGARRATRRARANEIDDHSPAVDAMSLGALVVPLPNRMVILTAGVPHRINTVSRAAGAHVRASVAGFFLRQ